MSQPADPVTARRARRADRPTAAGAARASLLALLLVVRLLAGAPARRRRLRAARVALGAAVAAHLAPARPGPSVLARPLAARQAVAARLAATEPPGRPAAAPAAPPAPRAARPSGAGALAESRAGAQPRSEPTAATVPARASRAARSARGDLVGDLERALRVAVLAGPRLVATVRLRSADARLGAWAAGLVEFPDPALAGARQREAVARRAVAEAGAELAASRRQALAQARLALRLTGEALADVARWLGAGLGAGTARAGARLGWAAVAVRRGLAAGLAGLLAGAAAAGTAVLSACAALADRIDTLVTPGGRPRPPATAGRPLEDPPPTAAWAPASPPPAEGDGNGWHAGTGDRQPTRVQAGPGASGASIASLGAPTEPWWLPSHLADPALAGGRPAGAHARRERDPVVAALASTSGRVRRFGRRAGRRLEPVVGALAAPPDWGRRGWGRFARPVAAALGLALVVGVVAALPTGLVMAGSVKAAASGLPDLDELKPLAQPERTQIYDRNGKLIEVLKDEQDRIVVPLSRMPTTLQQAVIAAEDERFYDHHGVDDRGILRAALSNLLSGDVSQGGSTITQQLVRQAYPDLKDRSITRKIKEAALAAQLEGKLSKQEILERYLNRVYFGSGYYGVEAASRGYFGRQAHDIDLAQAATLAGIIRSPETANPRDHKRRAKALRNSVLDRMATLGMVPAAEAAKAKKRQFKILGPRKIGGHYPWFVDGLRRQLEADPRLGRTRNARIRRLYEGGLRIYTTLDRDLQAKAEAAVAAHRPPAGPDIALISVEPATGAVRAVVGGRDYKAHAYNVAVQGRGRQPGSSFKPFVLAAALEDGISPDSVWESAPFRSNDVCGGTPWNVDNYEGGGSGLISVREGTWRSVNGVYARLMERLCPAKVADMAKRLGVDLDPKQVGNPSIALGAAEVRPIQMASAYATLASGGVYHQPTFVTRIDHHGKTLVDYQPQGERRVSAALAWQVTDVLKGVVGHGTGVAANIGRPEAGKTGTTQNYADAWFVGYTPALSTAVWMGDPKGQTPMEQMIGVRVTGGSFPAQVWHDYMLPALAAVPAQDWERPPEQLQYNVLPPPPTTTPPTTAPKKHRGGNGNGRGGGGNGRGGGGNR